MSERSLKLVRNIMIMVCVAMVMTALSIYDGPVELTFTVTEVPDMMPEEF